MEAAIRAARVLGRMPLRFRRAATRAAWRLSAPFRSEVGLGLDGLLSRSLGTGIRAARQIDRQIDYEVFLQTTEWFAGSKRSLSGLRADWNNTTIEDEALVARLAASGETVILAALHMGTYSQGIACLIDRHFPGRRVLILRGNDDDANDTEAMERVRLIAGELRIFHTKKEKDFLDAMRFARKGAVVVCFADLPASYGSPADVTLFREPARIAMGMDTLARFTKGVVLPFAVESTIGGDLIRCGEPFEVSGKEEAERAEIAAAIARQIEQFVYAAPAQWHMWTRLDEYRVPPSFGDVGYEAA